AYEQLAPGGGPLGLEYRGSAGEAMATATGREELYGVLLTALAEARKQEIERGVTLVGPHRDDLLLKLGQLPAKGYASHGESWSYALALRLASYELLRAEGNEPVLVLDDVFAELDSRRRERLAELVAPGEQGWVTAAAVGGVMGRWPQLVGPEVAQHCEPQRYDEDARVLTVQCDSTAWATQLRLLAPQLVARLNQDLGHGTVKLIKVLGPGGP